MRTCYALPVSFLLAGLDSVVNCVVSLLPYLGLEVKVDKLLAISVATNRRRHLMTHLVLLGSPLAVGIAVVDNLVAASITDFDGGVGKSAVRVPLDVVAGRLRDGEGEGATLVAVSVETLLDGEVKHVSR